MRRCRKRTRKGERKVDPPSVAAGPASFWPSGANCWPPYPPSQVPRTVPSHTWSHSNQLGPYPTENPSSRTGRPQLAATTSLKRDLWGDTGTRGGEKGPQWKKVEVEKGWRKNCALVRSSRAPLCPLCHVPFGQVNGGKCRCLGN